MPDTQIKINKNRNLRKNYVKHFTKELNVFPENGNNENCNNLFNFALQRGKLQQPFQFRFTKGKR